MLSGQGKPLWCTQREGYGGSIESSICFSIVYAQKYCPSSAPVFMNFKHFVQENVKICTGPNLGLLPSRRPGSTHFIQFLIYLVRQNNAMNFSSKRHQCHQNCCLNKPYFYVKNASNTKQYSYILYIFGNHTHREKVCHKALSYKQTIRLFRQCVQQPTLCAASYWRAGLAWL